MPITKEFLFAQYNQYDTDQAAVIKKASAEIAAYNGAKQALKQLIEKMEAEEASPEDYDLEVSKGAGDGEGADEAAAVVMDCLPDGCADGDQSEDVGY